MSKFGHLKKLDVQPDATADFKIVDMEGHPTLTMKIAGEKNKPYLNAMLAKNGSQMNSRRGIKVDADTMSETRGTDRELYSKFVITDWSGITTQVKGKAEEVPFTQEDCLDFLEQLPDYIFDDIRIFAGNPTNFIKNSVDAEGVGKNSKSG